ncbi:hypothetical protein F4823DRAFT_561762 [Ustulina deusta]|nr:hypothetical protein F4823DRAFT_561762 [Ustulina deusta]
MMFAGLLFTAVWLPGIAALSPTVRTSVDPKHDPNIVITVGKGSFTFTPNTVTANLGDEIVFEFWSDGHSVARSAFGFPCMPYEYIMPESTGFWSGDIPNVTTSSRPRFTITVNDTEPIFFYWCFGDQLLQKEQNDWVSQNGTWTLDKQDSFINPSILELQPGDPLPSELNGTKSIPPDDQNPHEIPTLSIGEIAGIAISSIAIVLLMGTLAYTCKRQGLLEKNWQQNTRANPNNLPLIDEPRPQGRDDDVPKSPPPQNQNHPNLMTAQPTNSGHWSLNSTVTSPCRSSFPMCRPGVVSDVASEVSLGHDPEQNRLEVPGSPVLPVELPADESFHIPKSS